MIEIHAIPVSLYCAKLRILLRHKGLDWRETPPPGGYGSAEYRRLVPAGNLPALRDGDLLLADGEAIAEYLEETHPRPAMLPGPPAARARARSRGRFHDTRLEPAVRALFPHLPGRAPAPEGFVAAQGAAIAERLAQLGDLLGHAPYEGALTLGDCGHPVTFAWIDALTPAMGLSIDWPAPVAAYRAAVEAVPAVRDELANYRPKLSAFLG